MTVRAVTERDYGKPGGLPLGQRVDLEGDRLAVDLGDAHVGDIGPRFGPGEVAVERGARLGLDVRRALGVGGPEAGDFTGPGLKDGYVSFPSGHTSAAFAVGTVLAKRYPKYKWAFYGLATLVGIARMQKSAHFPSDVLVGAGLGIYAANHAIQAGADQPRERRHVGQTGGH